MASEEGEGWGDIANSQESSANSQSWGDISLSQGSAEGQEGWANLEGADDGGEVNVDDPDLAFDVMREAAPEGAGAAPEGGGAAGEGSLVLWVQRKPQAQIPQLATARLPVSNKLALAAKAC